MAFTVRKSIMVLVFVFLTVSFASLAHQTAIAAETLKVGVLVPLSGAVAEGGTRIHKAIELATKEINEAGGVLGKQIELVVWDTEGNVEKGVSGAKKLILKDKVWGLIGLYRSGVTLAVQEESAKYKKIMMVTDSVSNQITGRVKEDYNKYKYTFRSGASIDQIVQSLVPFLTEVTNAKSYFYVSETTRWTTELGDVVEKFAKENNINYLGAVRCDPAAQEFTSEIAKVKEANPDAIICTLAGAAAIPFAKQYTELKVGKPIIYSLGTITFKKVIQDIGDKADYQSTLAFCWDVPITPKTIPFYEKFTAYYSRPGGYEDARAYDGMYILAEAIKKAGSSDTEKVIKALEETDFTGVSGRYIFDDSHQCKLGEDLLEGVIVEWVGGKDYILYPKKVATSKYIPAPWQ